MRAGTRRRLRLTAKVIIFGTLVGAAYGIALHLTVYDAPRWGALIGATHGFLISATIGWLEIFGVRTQPGRTVEQAPFLVTLAVKVTVYGSVMAGLPADRRADLLVRGHSGVYLRIPDQPDRWWPDAA